MNNDERMRQLLEQTMPEVLAVKEVLDEYDISLLDLMRTLYLAANIKSVSRFGHIKINIKNGEIVSIEGTNTFISEGEIVNKFNKINRR